jgi:hypothetical protein
MEAAALARIARARDLPFYGIKGVSDGPADRLPDFNRFLSAEGRFRLARFSVFAVLRPWHWTVLARMGRHSQQSARAMRDTLLAAFDGPGTPRPPDRPPNPGSG